MALTCCLFLAGCDLIQQTSEAIDQLFTVLAGVFLSALLLLVLGNLIVCGKNLLRPTQLSKKAGFILGISNAAWVVLCMVSLIAEPPRKQVEVQEVVDKIELADMQGRLIEPEVVTIAQQTDGPVDWVNVGLMIIFLLIWMATALAGVWAARRPSPATQ